MPTVLRVDGYQVIIFTSDHPPAHVHVRARGNLAKILLDPVEVERAGGFNSGEISDILSIVNQNRLRLLAEWDKFYPTR